MSSGNWLVPTATAALVATCAMAQVPPGDMCGQVLSARGEQETSLQTCMNELFDEQLQMIDSIEQIGDEARAIHLALLASDGLTASERTRVIGLMRDNREDIQLMRDQLERAGKENSAVEDSDYDDAFELADQQKGKSCKFSDMPFVESLDGEFPPGLKPFSGSTFDPKLGDGKCNVFKARIDNPGEPDDNQVVRVNERSENMCERVCADRMSDDAFGLDAASRPKKAERKERAVSALTDNIAAARRANEKLADGMARVSALRVRVASQVSRSLRDDSDSCEPADVARGLDEAAEVISLAKNVVAIVTASLELAKETARPPTKQDAAGFNASTAETPFAVAAGISKIVEQSVGFIEQGFKVAAVIAGRIQDNAQARCLQGVDAQVASLQESADETTAQLSALEAKVDELSTTLDEVLELLRTPPGRREGFPARP